jgi:AraC-like DNA-binding protein
MKLSPEDRKKIDTVKVILEKEFKIHYTHQQLAQKIGMNESKLQLGFKYLHKKTLYQYLRWVRIEKAKELLTLTDHNIKFIAEEVGYDVSNFNKRFKDVMAVTPFVWRKNVRAEAKRLAMQWS